MILEVTMLIYAATGHRPGKLRNEWNGAGPMSLWIQEEMRKIVLEEMPDVLISGMALGVDQIWAELAVIMNIPFIAAIPFKGQDSRWPEERRNKYRILLSKAQEVVNVSGQDFYKPIFMHQRNAWMVMKGDGLVAVWDGSTGGTGHCVEYARHHDKRIFYIDPRVYVPEEEEMDL